MDLRFYGGFEGFNEYLMVFQWSSMEALWFVAYFYWIGGNWGIV